jgi:hypothetical protein
MSTWTEATTEHFVVQADAPEEDTIEAARALERAYDGYAKTVPRPFGSVRWWPE